LGENLRKLQAYQAKRKFRGAANAIMAINRMASLGRSHSSEEHAAPQQAEPSEQADVAASVPVDSEGSNPSPSL
jgi:hypothetical protein